MTCYGIVLMTIDDGDGTYLRMPTHLRQNSDEWMLLLANGKRRIGCIIVSIAYKAVNA